MEWGITTISSVTSSFFVAYIEGEKQHMISSPGHSNGKIQILVGGGQIGYEKVSKVHPPQKLSVLWRIGGETQQSCNTDGTSKKLL